MNGLIRASLKNPYAVTVFSLTAVVLGVLCTTMIPIDILPVFKAPATQALTFYGGMPATAVENDITNRMERWTGQAAGTQRQESRSIVGASIVRNYFFGDVDPNGALTQVNSLALSVLPNLPPGTLPPVVLPFDPTSTTPVCLVALDSRAGGPSGRGWGESILYDVGRYEVRNMIMSLQGAVAPVVYGGKVRAVMVYLDRNKMQARGLSPLDVMRALDSYNLFLPTGDAKFGSLDFALDSNSMYADVRGMGDIPLRTRHGNAAYVRDVGTPEDAAFIQTNVVRVNGARQVYIPVFRQLGASTLSVVSNLKGMIADMESRLSRPGINLNLVMDQSIYVRKSIEALIQEGVLGAVLCSLVILVFLGQWRMTAIAIMTLPLSVLAAIACLYFTGNTINVMTLAGLSLAIGPMVDSAIICLENTHRHLGLGAPPEEAAFLGASEVAMPELVASLCTLLVLSPLALMPGLGAFLFRPMALAVAFAMISAYILSRTFVPARSAGWLRAHIGGHGGPAHGDAETFQIEDDGHAAPRRGAMARAFARWEAIIEAGIRGYTRVLDRVMRARLAVVLLAVGLLVAVLALLGSRLRREFFPEVDAGAFEMYVRAPSGTRIEDTERRIAAVEAVLKEVIPRHDLQMYISELGVTPDWSAAYTPNAGPMDAVLKIQLTPERSRSAQQYVTALRRRFRGDKRFGDLEFAFDAGGMIRGAMNEGKSTPINVRVTGKDQATAHAIATAIRARLVRIDGIVDARVIQRLNYPEYVIHVDRAKAADLGLTQQDVMRTVVAASNSSIQFNKHNFWIDPVNHNQYFVGVQYREKDVTSIDTLLDVPITSPVQEKPVPLRNLVRITRTTVPTEVKHYNIQPTIELTMGVEGRDLGHVADDVTRAIDQFGVRQPEGHWTPYDPSSEGGRTLLHGTKVVLSGEYERMRATFRDLGIGLVLASLLIYFLMVALFKSYVTPLVILFAVPIGLVGVVTVLYLTGTAINVQSLLGVIFMVGIVVSNTVLLVDFAQNLRVEEGLTPDQAIRKAASIRVRPVVMTALAAFFALVPMAMALERGSEANAPLGRAVIGGLLAGLVTTLLVVPSLYSLVVHDAPEAEARRMPRHETEADPVPDVGMV
jgi:multidrug efflux pump subunit AcrB